MLKAHAALSSVFTDAEARVEWFATWQALWISKNFPVAFRYLAGNFTGS
jgi:hypothetical protein